MIKKLSPFFFLALWIGASFAAPPAQLPDEPKKIVVDPDQTDIFAIPFDEDGEEQEEELESFEHYHRK